MYITGFSEKKYCVADSLYFKNGITQQCNILTHKINFYLGMCEVSTSYVKHNLSYEGARNDGSNGS